MLTRREVEGGFQLVVRAEGDRDEGELKEALEGLRRAISEIAERVAS